MPNVYNQLVARSQKSNDNLHKIKLYLFTIQIRYKSSVKECSGPSECNISAENIPHPNHSGANHGDLCCHWNKGDK